MPARSPLVRPEAIGEAKHVKDTRDAAALTGRALKAKICFNWQRKGRCTKGDACPKLHSGEPEAARAEHVRKVLKRKAEEQVVVGAGAPAEETPAKAKKEKKARATTPGKPAETKVAKRLNRPAEWTCPKCENTNWGRRAVCNGRTCGTSRPEHRSFPSKAKASEPSTKRKPDE